MSEMNNESLLEKYETLLLVVDDLQTKIGKLIKFYEQVKEKHNVYDAEVEKALLDLRKTKEASIEEVSFKASESKDDLAKGTKEIKKLLKDLNDVSAEVKATINLAKNFELNIPGFEERLALLEKQVKEGGVGVIKYIPFNYDEVLTAAELWKKYNGRTKTPIIAQMPSWSGDYCMVFTDYDEETNRITGRIYKDGEIYESGRSPNGVRNFRASMDFYAYKSPNEKSILRSEEEF